MVTAPSNVDVCALCTHSPDLSLHDGFVFSAYRSHADSFVSLPSWTNRQRMKRMREAHEQTQLRSPVKWHVKGNCAEMFGCASISPGAPNEDLYAVQAVFLCSAVCSDFLSAVMHLSSSSNPQKTFYLLYPPRSPIPPPPSYLLPNHCI